MTVRFNEISDEVLVNDRTNAIQQAPLLVNLAGGGFAFIWVDLHTDSIQAQIFDSAGNHVGAEIMLAALNRVGGTPAAVALASGGFALTWIDRNEADTKTLQLVQSFDADGEGVGSPTSIATTAVSTASTPAIAALAGGGFVTVRDTTFEGGLRGRLFDADGVPVGDEFLLTETNGLTDSKPSLTALAGGGFALAWQEASPSGPGTDIKIRTFDSSGAPTGAAFAASDSAGAQVQADVVALASGAVLVSWTEFDAGSWEVKARIFSAAGAPVGNAFMVNSSAAGDQQMPVAVALPDGSFVIAWSGAGGAGIDGSGIHAQIFDAAGNRIGDEYLVNTQIIEMQYSPTLTLLPDGNVAVGWISGGLFPGPLRGGVLQILDIATVNSVAGSGADESLAGTSGADDIFGAEGADIITGGGGRDWLYGEGGDDKLTGGDGRDRLEGGAGEDVLDGGAGNDILLGGDDDDHLIYDHSGEDRLFGGAGDDQFSVTHDLVSGLEKSGSVLVDGGDGNDRVDITWRGRSPAYGITAITIDGGAGDDLIRFNRYEGSAPAQLTLGAGRDTVVLGPYADGSFSSDSGGITITDFQTGTGGDVFDFVDNFVAHQFHDWDGGTNPFAAGFLRLRQVGADTLLEVRSILAYDFSFLARFKNVLATSFTADNLAGLAPDGSPFPGLTLEGTSGGDAYVGDFGADTIDGMGANDFILGGAGHDMLRGGDGADSVHGEQGNDIVEGGAGNDNLSGGYGHDFLDGGTGTDRMDGGTGNDVYIVDEIGDNPYEYPRSGIDEVRTALATYDLKGTNPDGPFEIEKLTGLGDAGQLLYGNDWANLIDGGLGDDSMAGRLGNDIYLVDSFGDSVIELAGEGTDEVRTALGTRASVYTLAANVENLTGTSPIAQAVEGNGLGNVIAMGAGADLVVLDDGGDDIVSGGNGNDYFYYGAAWTAEDRTDGGAGTDTIGLIGSTTIILGASSMTGIERMALYTSLYLPGTGPSAYDIMMSDANVTAGSEFFVTAASLQSNESLAFNGSAETNGKFTVHGGAGNDTIAGGSGSDFFLGNAGNDTLNGGGGNDFLYGGLGADQLTGGAGFDAFRYQSAAQSTAASMDHILDFTDLDRIDLSAIDADGNAGNGNQAFTFIGSNAFGNVAGQLRAYQSGADWFVEGDVNGDGIADLVVQVTITDPTLPVLGASDFNL